MCFLRGWMWGGAWKVFFNGKLVNKEMTMWHTLLSMSACYRVLPCRCVNQSMVEAADGEMCGS